MEGRQHRAGLSRRTRAKKRSGWDYASTGHLVCLVQTCVKGPLCYVMLCYVLLLACLLARGLDGVFTNSTVYKPFV